MSHFSKRTFALWATAVALGAAVAFLSWYWRYAWLPPGVWEDVAVAAGIRPPEAPFPLLWHALAHQLFQWLDMAQAIRVLRLAGHVSLGLAAMLLLAVLNEMLPSVMQGRLLRMSWCRWIVRVVLLQGVALFACSDPVWEIGQAFCPAMFHFLLFLAAALIFVRYALRRGVIAGWYWTMALLGVLAGETVLGVVLAVGCLVVCRVRAGSNADTWTNPMADPFVRTVTMRRMTLSALAGWLVVVACNVVYFCMMDGLEAHELSASQYAVTYLVNYWKSLAAASTPSGWMLFVVVVLVPLVLSMVHIGVATDDENFLPYWYAAFFLLVGIVAFLQLAGWRSFWFWTWTGGQNSVSSPLLKCLCSFVSVQTFTYALCVLEVEVYFRNYKRIAGIKFQDSVEENARGADIAASFRGFNRIARLCLLLEPLAVLALVVPYRMQTTTRRIMGAIYDCVRQTVLECQDARYVFTDGALDTAVELCAREQGRNLLTLSVTAGHSERERYLRRRGAEDDEDGDMLSVNAMDALRTWLRFKRQRLEDVAVQLGFEQWKWRRGKERMPPVAGMVARPAGFPPGLAEAGVEAAHGLGKRILDIYADDEKLESVSPGLRDLFSRMQWRVARMCRLRADNLDREGDKERAIAESKLADDLDERNESFTRIRRQLEMAGQGSSRLTPREGLRLAMERPNFHMAAMFARQVLVSDPRDLEANFAMGMFYHCDEQYGQAEAYLRKCLERDPRNASILNNLAVAQLRQGHLDEAEENARKAVAANGKLAEARRTLENVLNEKKAAEKAEREKLPQKNRAVR